MLSSFYALHEDRLQPYLLSELHLLLLAHVFFLLLNFSEQFLCHSMLEVIMLTSFNSYKGDTTAFETAETSPPSIETEGVSTASFEVEGGVLWNICTTIRFSILQLYLTGRVQYLENPSQHFLKRISRSAALEG
ncbi:hypothetical protein AVEN_162386-1 [Araneus ventricosus]|uniref:Uncharacterized protein n=1 Tax=Araneus ventricosus TaxID=182803 RepID=A0A4Y2GJI6_ARAVE|nr:hypothetical protein AVEN_162386-1 [Araneus ventricosus]